MAEKKRRPPKTIPDITQKSWDRARVPIYDFLQSMWQGYSGQPAPHATTHKGGSDNVAGSGTPITIKAGVVGDAGNATNGLAPFDHVHAALTGTPVSVGIVNAEGTASSLARSDHVHDAASFTGGLLYLGLVS